MQLPKLAQKLKKLLSIHTLTRGLLNTIRLTRYIRIASKVYEGKIKSQSNKIETFTLLLNKKSIKVSFRPYKADLLIFVETFINKQYFDQSLSKSPVIIDLGGNVGYASLFFISYYAPQKIILVEPDVENLNLARENLRPWIEKGECILYQTAIHSTETCLYIEGANLPYNIKTSTEAGEKRVAIKTITMSQLLQENKLEKIDLLKIDIEGAEKALLETNNKWLHSVHHILIEIHPPLNESWLTDVLSPFDFQILKLGDIFFAKKTTTLLPQAFLANNALSE